MAPGSPQWRRRSARAWSARAAVAGALLALGMLSAVPFRAEAQTTPPTCTPAAGDLWCGVLTVGSFLFALGYMPDVDRGALTDDDFEVGTNSYTFTGIFVRLVAEVPRTLRVTLSSSLTAADRAKLVLHVGGDALAFSDAEFTTSAARYEWPHAGLDWSSGSFVTLRLRLQATNSAPEFAAATAARAVAENSAAGTAVGAPVTATDADSGDTLEYRLEGTDAGSFTIDSASGQIRTRTGVSYDHEAAKNSYAVTVKASDGTASATIAVTIDVTDVAEQPDRPARPTVTAKAQTSDSLEVSWSVPGLNGGPAITGYEVQYRQGAGGTWSDWRHGGSATTTTIGGLTADTEYQVRVRARNGELDSDWSEPSEAVRTNAVPVVTIAADRSTVNENEGAAGFTLSRTGTAAAALR